MAQGYIAVPFKADKSDGLVEVTGIAKVSSAGIVMEFESKILGLFGGDVKEVRISHSDILSIEFKKGLYRFFARIIIKLNNVSKLSELPNSGGKTKLKIKREDFEAAQRAVAFLNQNENEPADEQLPPTQTPVAELFEAPEDKYKTNDLNETRKLD